MPELAENRTGESVELTVRFGNRIEEGRDSQTIAMFLHSDCLAVPAFFCWCFCREAGGRHLLADGENVLLGHGKNFFSNHELLLFPWLIYEGQTLHMHMKGGENQIIRNFYFTNPVQTG